MSLFTGAAFGQSDSAPETPEQTSNAQNNKHILGIIPNFRTIPEMKIYAPVTAREKFTIASQDAFDRGTLGLAVLFAAQSQLSNGNPSFGHGVPAFAKYAATSWGDYVIGDYMTEAIFPALLHQDPRFFRRGKGSTLSRLSYAAGQIFITHGDNGHSQFNFSEVLGNSAGVAISNSYYADNRTASDAVSKLGVQLGVDMASNVLKEFWPDIERRFTKKRR